MALVLDLIKSFGPIGRLENCPVSAVEEVLDSIAAKISDFKNAAGSLITYINLYFGSRIVHGRQPRSNNLAALDVLANEVCKAESEWKLSKRYESAEAKRKPSLDSVSDTQVPIGTLAGLEKVLSRATMVEVSMDNNIPANVENDRPGIGRVIGEPNGAGARPPTPRLPRRHGHHGCGGKFVFEGVYEFAGGVLRKVSGPGPAEIDPAGVLDPTGELSDRLLETYG